MVLDPVMFQPILERLAWLALVIALDLILGVVVSLKKKVFQWQYLADFLGNYGPKIFGWLALEVLDFLPSEYKIIGSITGVLGVGAYSLLFISAVGSVLGHVQSIGGLSVRSGPSLERYGLPPTETKER